jgi:hypothetical protein
VYLLSFIGLFARQSVLKLFNVLVQKFFLRLLLLFNVIILFRDLLHYRVNTLLTVGLKIRGASIVFRLDIPHLACRCGMSEVGD